MKKIAFIKDGMVLAVLNCNDKLFDAITTADSSVDASSENSAITTGWLFDGTNFSAPSETNE
jgi:hypothetical protein